MSRLGIDIGGTSVKAACIDADGSVRTGISSTYQRPGRVALRDAVRQAIGSLGTHTSADVRSVGLCVPGRKTPSGDAVELAVNVPGLEGYLFTDLLREALGCDPLFRVVSDAEAATIDASRAFPDARRVLGIAIGTGVGASLIEDGRPLRLGRGSVGHVGQIDIGPIGCPEHDGPFGPDGGRNTLEAYLGVAAFRKRFGDDFTATLQSLPETDPGFIALVRLVRIVLPVYTPDLILFMGGVGIALASRAEALRVMIGKDLTRVAPPGWTLGFGTHQHHAAFGAARLAVDNSDAPLS